MIEVLENQTTVVPLDTPNTIDLGGATSVDVITAPVTTLQAAETLAPVDVLSTTSTLDLSAVQVTPLEVVSPGPQGPKGDTGAPGTGSAIYNETPTGAINGVNTTFTAVNNFRGETLAVYLNGLRQRPTDDFIVVGANTFQTTLAPLANDRLSIDYYLL